MHGDILRRFRHALPPGADHAETCVAMAGRGGGSMRWEWSAEGLYNPDPTNDAYRLGVNDCVHAMTQ